MKDGELTIDSDGMRGQFTSYYFRPPDSEASRTVITAEVKVLSNRGRAATVSVPFGGKLRLFSDRVELAHDASVRVPVEPGVFHAYRIERDGGKMRLSVDGKEALALLQADTRIAPQAWTPHHLSPYAMEFGNEGAEDTEAALEWAPGFAHPPVPEISGPARSPPPLYLKNITPAVTGSSVWRRFEVRYEDPRTGVRTASWNGATDGFPDQYQLDRILEIDATIYGADQGYSGWTELEDGRVLVLNYTDDTARWNRDSTGPQFGVSWIRGTFVQPEDLRFPPARPAEGGR